MHRLAERIARKYTEDGNEYAKLVNIANEEIKEYFSKEETLLVLFDGDKVILEKEIEGGMCLFIKLKSGKTFQIGSKDDRIWEIDLSSLKLNENDPMFKKYEIMRELK